MVMSRLVESVKKHLSQIKPKAKGSNLKGKETYMSNDTVPSAASTKDNANGDSSESKEAPKREEGLTTEEQALFLERFRDSIKNEPPYRW